MSCSDPYGSGCLVDWTGYTHNVSGNPDTADVLVVGDSITTLCHDNLTNWLADRGLTVAVDYWSSRPTADRPDVSASPGAVSRLLGYPRAYSCTEPFRLIVMASGTNDIFNAPLMAPAIERVKAAGLKAPIAWGTVYAARFAVPQAVREADLRNAGWVNEQIKASGFPTVDWFVDIAAKPSRAGMYLSDGIHPNEAGQEHWAAVYAGRITQLVDAL